MPDGSQTPVERITLETLEEPVKVYNFEVADWHTYHVGTIGVLVHNKCKNYESAKDFEEAISNMDSGERVATVKNESAAVANGKGLVKDYKISKRNKRIVYKDPKTTDYYSVDTQHGRFECCNKRGTHLGEVDFDFNPTKSADLSGGHDLNVK